MNKRCFFEKRNSTKLSNPKKFLLLPGLACLDQLRNFNSASFEAFFSSYISSALEQRFVVVKFEMIVRENVAGMKAREPFSSFSG